MMDLTFKTRSRYTDFIKVMITHFVMEAHLRFKL